MLCGNSDVPFQSRGAKAPPPFRPPIHRPPCKDVRPTAAGRVNHRPGRHGRATTPRPTGCTRIPIDFPARAVHTRYGFRKGWAGA